MVGKKLLGMTLLVGMLVSQSVPTARAAAYCDQAQFVSDLTAPDGSSFAPGTAFTKTWRLMNIGTCPWTTAYNLVWTGGDSVGAPLSVQLPVAVAPGQMVDVSVNLTAPMGSGHYKGLFKISNASGSPFGIGSSASDPFWVDINVIETSAVIFDFVVNAQYAQWKSGAGIIPFPGASGDNRGFAYPVNNPHLEDDSFDTAPGLLVVPQNKFNGYIQAVYPEFRVQQGDRLQTLVNCEFGATGCYVTFRIDYLSANGVQKTLWSWKETYDRRFYRANLDLSSLAGQNVRFVFLLLSSGLASGDRAVWGSPRIVRTGTQPPATLTPLPTLPPTATPLGQPPPTIAPPGCDKASFVTDVTVPDGTLFSPGAAFTKTWRLKNIGSCTWTTSYKLVYYSGEQMSAPTTVNLPLNVPSNQTVEISVNMVAPATAGRYRGFWILANASGHLFGIGTNAAQSIWVEINVAGDAPIGTGYDFTANACSAEWKSGAGPLPCPGTGGNGNGFILRLDVPKLEDGSTGTPGLLAVPQNRYNGYIQGFYPALTVQPGDKFQTTTGCEYGAACYLTYRLDYMLASGYIGTFWSWREQNDGRVHYASIDLAPLAGRSVRFILTVLATGSASNDRAVWGSPRIVRSGGTSTSTPTPTFTPLPSDWLKYTNPSYGFEFRYPPQAQIVEQSNTSLKMNLPFTPGTNLVEKYLQMSVNENVNPCQSPLSSTSPPGSPTETVVFNGISFLKQVGGDAGVGHLHEWVGFSTLKNNACISMDFVLHSLDPGAYSTPPPVFDKGAESLVFTQIMSTFGWLPATLTPVPPTVVPILVPAPNIRKLFMIDAVSGWAISDAYALRTYDGGATWYSLTAPGISSIRNAFFQNPSKGWVLTSDSLYRTIDGGATWTRYSVPFNGGHIQFLDDTNGFVLSGELSGMHKHAVSLYQTSDGGATWTLKYAVDPGQPNNTLPFSGHKNGMAFRDTSTGWVGGYIPSPGAVYLYKTTNGGATWILQPVALPPGYESADINVISPTFFGSNDGILPVWMSGSAGRDLFIYVTHDGGSTWARSAGVVPGGGTTDFISINDGFAWNGSLQVTHNSGTSWSAVTPNVSFGDNVPIMEFVSATTGWILTTDMNGNPALYRTNDGGSIWTLLFGAASLATQTPTNTPTATPPASPTGFVQAVVNTLNARNFDAVRASMDQSFVFAYWQSQGSSYPADVALESLRTSSLSATTPLVSDADKDLTVLLDGFNQYSVMGLDPAKSQALFVSGWGRDGTDEAILYATRRSDGSLYWYGVLIAPGGFARFSLNTPTPTPTPAALQGPYAVIGVTLNDVLNIRAGAGVGHPVVGSFPPEAVNVMRTGPTASADNATWVEVQNPGGGTGWVNSNFLTEYVSHEAFCADARIPMLIEQLKGSVNQSSGDMFAALVSPVHGTDVRLWAYSSGVNFNVANARTIFTSTDSYNWGGGPSGVPDVGPFKDIVQPKLLEVLNVPNMETYCDNLTKVFPLFQPWPYPNIHYYNLYRPGTPGVELDFRTWLIGFEYIDNQPYLYGMVTIPWEP